MGRWSGRSSRSWAAYLLVILAALMLATLLTVVLDRYLRAPMLGGFNRIGGAVLGVMQAAVLAAFILVLLLRLPVLELDEAVRQAPLPRAVLEPLPVVLSYLPPELAEVRAFFLDPIEARRDNL
jgi:uncharacterized membrane protein required for colicin V production